MPRDPIPESVRRAVLVEAGHRCAIPTCHATTTEIAHIVPWAESQNNCFDNLIALCPTCHTRYDQKKEIDRKSMLMYKQNLALLNNRYGEIERRLFEALAVSGERLFMLGAGGDVMVANAVKDGLFVDEHLSDPTIELSFTDGRTKSFSMNFVFSVTDRGADFIQRYKAGLPLA